MLKRITIRLINAHRYLLKSREGIFCGSPGGDFWNFIVIGGETGVKCGGTRKSALNTREIKCENSFEAGQHRRQKLRHFLRL